VNFVKFFGRNVSSRLSEHKYVGLTSLNATQGERNIQILGYPQILECLHANNVFVPQCSALRRGSHVVNPLMPTVAIMCTAIKHPLPDRVKLSFIIFDIRALCP